MREAGKTIVVGMKMDAEAKRAFDMGSRQGYRLISSSRYAGVIQSGEFWLRKRAPSLALRSSPPTLPNTALRNFLLAAWSLQ
ncbi:hypothetical protein HPP92_004191 [Vanilla planifolia]|uniref:Uncharacterized protein n=1 Tax=Vanilla planifolia TaxID=51239 RepID=A0A835RW90_VANPL|nr:hypothetical protein HPP92_004626 [Vanilla planifolia]KAG0493197.1 hypothetical protein HPP92_004191 [Vanilla planifolia]